MIFFQNYFHINDILLYAVLVTMRYVYFYSRFYFKGMNQISSLCNLNRNIHYFSLFIIYYKHIWFMMMNLALKFATIYFNGILNVYIFVKKRMVSFFINRNYFAYSEQIFWKSIWGILNVSQDASRNMN